MTTQEKLVKITVVLADGEESKWKLASTEDYKALLARIGGELIDHEGYKVLGFSALQDGEYTLSPAVEPIVTLEVSLRKKTKILSWKKEDLTMESLELLVREKFDLPLARLSFALKDANDELLDNDEKLDAIPADETTRVTVTVTRVGFSSILTVKDALQLLHQEGDSIPISDSVFPVPLEVGGNNEELLHAVSTLQRLHAVAPLPQGCEATRRLYIDPILLAAARVAGPDVLLEVEKEYENQDVWGAIDYVFKCNGETICVTEGKKDQLDRGVIQNIAQLAAVADDRKRKRKISEISTEEKPIYGIATTYLNWQFLVLKDGMVSQSSIYSMKDAIRDDVGGIIGRIVSILNSGKGSTEYLIP